MHCKNHSYYHLDCLNCVHLKKQQDDSDYYYKANTYVSNDDDSFAINTQNDGGIFSSFSSNDAPTVDNSSNINDTFDGFGGGSSGGAGADF